MLQFHVTSHMSTLSINDKRQNQYPVYVSTKDMKLGFSTFWRSPYLNGTGLKNKKRELPIVVPPRMCSRQSQRTNRSSVRKGILKNPQPDSGSEDSRLKKKKPRRSKSFSVKPEIDIKRVQFGEKLNSSKDSQSEIVKHDSITKVAEECNSVISSPNVVNSAELEPRPATAMGIERNSPILNIERIPFRQSSDSVQNGGQVSNTAHHTATNPPSVSPNRLLPPRARILRRANTAAAIIISNPIPEVSKTEPSSTATTTKPTDSCTALPGDSIQTRPSGCFLSQTPTMADQENLGDDISSEHMNEKISESSPTRPRDAIKYKPPNGILPSKSNQTPKRPKTCFSGNRAILSNHTNFCDKDKTIRILKWLQDVDDVQLKEGKFRAIIDDLQEQWNSQI